MIWGIKVLLVFFFFLENRGGAGAVHIPPLAFLSSYHELSLVKFGHL